MVWKLSLQLVNIWRNLMHTTAWRKWKINTILKYLENIRALVNHAWKTCRFTQILCKSLLIEKYDLTKWNKKKTLLKKIGIWSPNKIFKVHDKQRLFLKSNYGFNEYSYIHKIMLISTYFCKNEYLNIDIYI